MYKLLIADDEEYIRTGLTEFIKWDKYGIKKVYTAADNKEVLNKVNKYKPDVLIIDIRLPEVSGLDLIPIIKKNNSKIEIIIISGYRYFEYARRAVALGAVDYITKPINEEQIQKVVKKCIENIEKRKQAGKHSDSKQKFILNLLTDTYSSKEEISEKAKELNISDTKNYLPFGVVIDDWGFMKSFYPIKKQKEIKEKIIYYLYEIINEKYKGIIAGELNEKIYAVIILNKFVAYEEYIKFLKDIIFKINKTLHVSITIGIDKLCNCFFGWNNIREKIDWCLSKKFFEGEGKVFVYEILSPLYKQMDKHKNNFYILKYEQELSKYILSQDECEIKTIIKNISNDIFGFKSEFTEGKVKLIYLDILKGALKIIEQKNRIYVNFIEERRMKISIKMMHQDTFEKLNQWLEKEIINLFLQFKNLVDNPTKKIIKEVLTFINENYDKKIGLQDAAEFVHLNASYLSKIFSEEMHIPFSKYLMKIRMTKAEQLMQDPRMKIYEIAELVGYNDIKYFTKIFKQVKGMSPSKYRRKYI